MLQKLAAPGRESELGVLSTLCEEMGVDYTFRHVYTFSGLASGP